MAEVQRGWSWGQDDHFGVVLQAKGVMGGTDAGSRPRGCSWGVGRSQRRRRGRGGEGNLGVGRVGGAAVEDLVMGNKELGLLAESLGEGLASEGGRAERVLKLGTWRPGWRGLGQREPAFS